jgi:gluconolactonase
VVFIEVALVRFAVVVTATLALTAGSGAQSLQPVPRVPGVFGDGSALDLVRDGFGFTEGPVGTADGGLYFTDTGVQPTRIYRLEPDGEIRLFRDTLNRANGLALERDGKLIAAESNGGRIIRVGTDGGIVSIASKATTGQALINPNDLIADRRGGIYFTHFVRGVRGQVVSDRQGFVYYVPPGATQAVVIANDLGRPNGLSLTDDEKTLIVDDSDSDKVYAFELQRDGMAKSKRPFATLKDIPPGRTSGADGLTIDRTGRVYVATSVGVQIFDGSGQYLGTLAVPGTPANVAFSGADKRTLYITAGSGLYRIHTVTQGLDRLGK